jgi:hypothetical protein
LQGYANMANPMGAASTNEPPPAATETWVRDKNGKLVKQ